jgi:hypothetical protein
MKLFFTKQRYEQRYQELCTHKQKLQKEAHEKNDLYVLLQRAQHIGLRKIQLSSVRSTTLP